MNNPSSKYICTNPACESYYDASLVEFTQDDVIPGDSSETCCPKCGKVLITLDYYLDEKKKEKSISQKKIIVNSLIGFVGIAIIVSIVLFIYSGKHSDSKPQVSTKVEKQNVDTVKISTSQEKTVDEEIQKPEIKETVPPKQVDKPKVKTSSTTNGTQSKTFSDGSRYVGEMKNGKMNGLGTYYYNSEQLISDRDPKKRMANKGDYITGEWYEGRLVNGKLFDSENNQKEVVIIGR